MTGPYPSDLIVREPSPTEVGRVLHLFRAGHLPRQVRVFVAVKTRPLERFVAAAAWWPVGDKFSFRLVVQPGSTSRLAACSQLIQQIARCGRALGLANMQYADLLPDKSEWVPLLKENGFVVLHSERYFEVSSQRSRTRTVEAFEKYKSKIPAGWHTESIRYHTPEAVIELIAPYRLMPAEQLHDYWRADSVSGFELDFSSMLFDGPRPIGTFLARLVRDSLCVDVRVVHVDNRLLRSLGNICLLYHVARRWNPNEGFHWLQFRGGATEHRETANLAMRMAGRELSPRHIFSKAF